MKRYVLFWAIVILFIWSPLNRDTLGGQVETIYRILESVVVTVHYIVLYFVLEGL